MTDREKPIAWIEVISQEEATGDLADAYDALKGADGRVENLYLAMSQTPQVLQPADAHYVAVLHNPDNPLEPWLAELVATYVAILCGSNYAAINHGDNVRFRHPDTAEALAILASVRDGSWSDLLKGTRAGAALAYTQKLSLAPARMCADDIAALRAAGFDDKSISYIVQIAASFAYWARITNGLGIRLGETIGLAKANISELELP